MCFAVLCPMAGFWELFPIFYCYMTATLDWRGLMVSPKLQRTLSGTLEQKKSWRLGNWSHGTRKSGEATVPSGGLACSGSHKRKTSLVADPIRRLRLIVSRCWSTIERYDPIALGTHEDVDVCTAGLGIVGGPMTSSGSARLHCALVIFGSFSFYWAWFHQACLAQSGGWPDTRI